MRSGPFLKDKSNSTTPESQTRSVGRWDWHIYVQEGMVALWSMQVKLLVPGGHCVMSGLRRRLSLVSLSQVERWPKHRVYRAFGRVDRAAVQWCLGQSTFSLTISFHGQAQHGPAPIRSRSRTGSVDAVHGGVMNLAEPSSAGAGGIRKVSRSCI